MNDEESRNNLLKWVLATFGGIDCLVNNAGFGPFQDLRYKHEGPIPEDLIDETFDINYKGLVRMIALFTQAFYEDSKIINIGSRAGKIDRIGTHIANRVIGYASGITPSIEHLQDIMDEFKQAAMKGKHLELGFRNSVYHVSKILVMRFTEDILPKLLTPNQ